MGRELSNSFHAFAVCRAPVTWDDTRLLVALEKCGASIIMTMGSIAKLSIPSLDAEDKLRELTVGEGSLLSAITTKVVSSVCFRQGDTCQ